MASFAPATDGGTSPVLTPDAPLDAPVNLLPPLASLPTKKHGLIGKQTGKRKSVAPDRPRNKEEREAMRYSPNPSMFTYIKLPAGRPTNPVIPTVAMTVALESTATLASNASPASASATPASATKAKGKTTIKSSAKRGKYCVKHDDGGASDAWVNCMLTSNNRSLADTAMYAKNPHAIISRSTLNSRLKSSMAKNVSTDVSTAKITVAQYHPFERKSDLKINAGALTTRNDRELLQSIAKQRDEMNRGMTRKDMIVLISELHSTDQKTAENHFYYLIRAKALPDLKKGGRVVTAQATTTNRTAITTKKLLRTYNTTLEAWRIQSERNGWDERDEGACDKKEFDRLRDGLTWNLDETCFRAEDGVLKIIGSNERKKHEKNTSDSRLSITVVRIGSAAGIEGPRIYLGKGKEDPPF